MRLAKKIQGQKAWEKGHRGEFIALWMLRLKGYHIQHKRYKTPVGEVDLIAKKRDTLIFIEVKVRSSFEEGMCAVHLSQQNRIRRAAEYYLMKQKKMLDVRFDVVLVKTGSFPVHMKNAF